MSTPEQELAARLTEAARTVTEALSPEEAAAIVRYQGLDRSYELVASVLRGQRSPRDLSASEAELVTMVLRALPLSIARWRVPEPLRAYRGQRSVAGFLGSIARRERVLVADSFLSTTIFREVALDEFTKPSGPGGPALLEISVPVGTPALWVPPVGDPALAYQGELLFDQATRIAVRGEREDGGILVLDCEVLA